MTGRPTIVCAVSDSPRARRVADYARRLAEALGARVVLAHAFDPMMVPAPPASERDVTVTWDTIVEQERERERFVLAATADVLESVEHVTVQPEGEVRAEVLRLVREHAARLLVIGSAARKPLDRILQGSVSAELAVGASCPVVVVTDDAALDPEGPLLAAFDGSEHSLRAARSAAGLATALQRKLVLLHVVAPGEARVEADAELARELHAASRACADAGGSGAYRLDVEVAVGHGDPVEQIAAAAREQDASLVVVGSRGRNAVRAAVLGSVSAGIVRVADRPVLVAGPHAEAPAAAGDL